MKKTVKTLAILGIAALGLTGCYDTNTHANAWNIFIITIGIIAGLVLLTFIAMGIISSFYKGKDVEVKVLKKSESKVLRGNTIGRSSPGYKGSVDLSRRARRQKGRLRYTKVTVEFADGKEKVLKCNDIVIYDKLRERQMQKIRIRFGEIVKILKK